MEKRVLFSAIVMAMFGLTGCDNEDNVVTNQQEIDSYIDVSKIRNIKDWHFVERTINISENSGIQVDQTPLADLPDWLPYVVARYASKVPMSVLRGKWNDEDVYMFQNVEMSTHKIYDSNGNRIGSDALVAVLTSTDWSLVASLVKEEEDFDATAMFGKHIDSELVGVWRYDSDINASRSYLEFRGNGSGRLWTESDSPFWSGSRSRFLYSIVDAKLTGAASNWIIVKMATEGSGLTRYESFVVNDGILYYAEDFSPYFSSSGFKRVNE